MPNQQFATTYRGFKRMARLYGLPGIIRVDHGTPFSANGLGRLSRLSVWWIEQGIAVEFTRPGHPQDNGSHERMHRDLKAGSHPAAFGQPACPTTTVPTLGTHLQSRKASRSSRHAKTGRSVPNPHQNAWAKTSKSVTPKTTSSRRYPPVAFYLLRGRAIMWENTLPVAGWDCLKTIKARPIALR